MPARKKFPLNRLEPQRGTIGGFLFENRHVGLRRTLFHTITVPLKAFTLPGEKKRVKTEFQLDFIELPEEPFQGYAALAGTTYEVPEGYVDGSIYVRGAHNPLNVTSIAFSHAQRGLVYVRIAAAIDFESEGSGFANSRPFMLDVALRPSGIRIDAKIVSRARRKGSRALLAGFVDPAIVESRRSVSPQTPVPLLVV